MCSMQKHCNSRDCIYCPQHVALRMSTSASTTTRSTADCRPAGSPLAPSGPGVESSAGASSLLSLEQLISLLSPGMPASGLPVAVGAGAGGAASSVTPAPSGFQPLAAAMPGPGVPRAPGPDPLLPGSSLIGTALSAAAWASSSMSATAAASAAAAAEQASAASAAAGAHASAGSLVAIGNVSQLRGSRVDSRIGVTAATAAEAAAAAAMLLRCRHWARRCRRRTTCQCASVLGLRLDRPAAFRLLLARLWGCIFSR